jgi:ferredoxin
MKCEIVYYSATGSTESIVKAFSRGLDEACSFSRIDMHSYETAEASDADLLVFASPVYSAGIPKRILKCLEKKCAGGIPVVGIVVYGNIHYGVSLSQLRDLAKKHGCPFTGAGAFIAEHTYSFHDAPVAEGRPDTVDLKQATLFGRKVKEKLASGDRSDVNPPPADFPAFVAKIPEKRVHPEVKLPVITGECNRCGLCVRLCPALAIHPDTLEIDTGECLRCFACVKRCPRKARRGEFRFKKMRYAFARIGRGRKEAVWCT